MFALLAAGLLALSYSVPARAQGTASNGTSGSSVEAGRPSAAKKLLTYDRLLILLSGNSLAGNGKVKDPKLPYDWVAHYAADGTLTMKLKPAWGGLILVGRWWMKKDGQTCRIFTKPQKKPEGCWRFFREGNFYRFVPSSGQAVEGRAAHLKGNALKK